MVEKLLVFYSYFLTKSLDTMIWRPAPDKVNDFMAFTKLPELLKEPKPNVNTCLDEKEIK